MQDLSRRSASGAAADMALASAIALAAFALYLVTLQPDFGGPEDTPKFQFLGYVLGTAHPPGYPLYVFLTHLFVKLPIRTIAYRANLFSAVMAALACGLSYVMARQIGSTRWAAAFACLGLATGASFWRNAVIAEVYSLAAVMVALTVVLLLAWSVRGGTGYLLAAVATFSVGLGNHLTIVAVAPAAILYVLWRGWRSLTPRIVAAAALIVLLGVSQYGFIILRTQQGAAHLESRASSVSELVSVVAAERFAKQRFAFGPRALLTVQLPAVLSVLGRELGILGVLFLIGGLARVVARRNSAGALVSGAALGLLAMILNLLGDLKGFVNPIVVLLWPLVAIGVGAVRELLESRPVFRVPASALTAAALVAIPVTNVRANYADVDRSGQTEEGKFFRSVFGQLPDRAAIVAEDYFFDMALLYYQVTGEGGPNRGIGRIPFDPRIVHEAVRAGRPVFAFGRAAAFLGARGLPFERARLVGPPLGEWLTGLPRGTVIVGAAAYSAVPFELSSGDRPPSRLRRFGVTSRESTSMPRGRPFAVFALVTSNPSAHALREADEGVSLPVDAGTLAARLPSLPGPLGAFADESGARVQLADRTIASIDKGIVLAVFNAEGTLWRTLEFRSGESIRVEHEAAIYELKGESPCVELTTDRWTDVTPFLSTGSVLATVPEIGSVTIETELSSSCAGPAVRVEEMLGAGSARQLSRAATSDRVSLVHELTRWDTGRPLFRMAFDCPPSQAQAKVRRGGTESNLTLCAHRPPALFRAAGDRAVLKPDFESEPYFGSGWHDSERTPTGRVRRAGAYATLLLPLTSGYSYQIALDLANLRSRVEATLNGEVVGRCDPGDGGRLCDVMLPSKIVRDGVNALMLTAVPSSSTPPASLTFQGARIRRRVD